MSTFSNIVLRETAYQMHKNPPPSPPPTAFPSSIYSYFSLLF